jgi:hypothetical protein
MLLCRKVGVTVFLIALGLIASFSFVWPASAARMGSVSFVLSGDTLLGLVLVALAWTGTYWAIHQHRPADAKQSTFPYCILPSAFTAAVWALIGWPTGVETRLTGVVLSSVALAWLIVSEYYVINLTGQDRTRAQWVVELVVYVVAMLLYLAIAVRVSMPSRGAVAVALATAALGMRLLADILLPLPCGSDITQAHLGARPLTRASGWFFIPALGLLSGLLSWLLRSLLPWPLAYSLTLVASLYVMVGIVRHHLLGRLTWRVALEYLLVGLFCLALLFFFARQAQP